MNGAKVIEDRGFHVFVYGTLRGGHALLAGCRRVETAVVQGTLYDTGAYPALMMYGDTSIEGEIWHCPDAARLAALDAYEVVERGLFRRIALDVQGTPCWCYVAGPALAHELTPARRVASGRWRA